MPVLTAIGVVLLVLVLVDLALTAGIIRRLRGDATPLAPGTNPRPGFRVSLERDSEEWPSGAADMMSDWALVAFVMKDCPGCERLRRQIDLAGPLPVPLYAVGDPSSGAAEQLSDYLASWPARTRLIAPQPIDLLDSFGRPDTYPTLVLLDDGVVRASGHRMNDVADAMAALGMRPLPNHAGR
jgi:hypothetical protein